ncbi:phosphoribosylformylglycinamidine cyclo-ligase [Paenactinomyces guangxiensis]|uniref:Phosphoribosylformylglycinamidine cyclo-ligase n=1 Tax=Paenactinomyces guangxiensis TaxID=1490290 RepID=A0A7W2A990_9BACL|nr:phosphoribosylformylglycinamidine cyclo-ligase [Paenactinomyces guangxiensis]MBA4495485.1 phosphoribosylformylglycinamidine cyclo-ligase [Paenactinomyces guangxiensis]MBH8592392.1 phosphoribosylformylglycinamidine cyclo-ligase [Paenactinomyces guangxiensis]
MSEAYKAAGVNIDAGNETVERIRAHVRRTARPEVLGDIGGFGGLFALKDYQNPVLVSATDGVGTKLKVAFALDRHDTIGIDCVAMCVNDIVVQGAEPLFFLDYLATGQLSPIQAEAVVKGIADGCEQAGCALVGGETAEMPGMYAAGEYDVAGFCVGVVERDRLLNGAGIEPGDVLIGLASNGLHSNGFSLARRVLLDSREADFSEQVPESDQTLAEALLAPTRIYVRTFLELMNRFTVKGGAHITGGGLIENVPRMLPEGCRAEVDATAWETPAIFKWIARLGNVSAEDMFHTFNMGIGMVIAVPAAQAKDVVKAAEELGERATVIGKVIAGEKEFSWAGGLQE